MRELFFAAATVFAALPIFDEARAQAVFTPTTVTEEGEAIHQALLSQTEEHGFSGAVIVERGGEPILEAGYGYADRETMVPYSIDTVSQIDSNAKQFTGLAVVMLAEEGLLDMDAPISTYLPEIPAASSQLTLNQLLTHSAGLPQLCGEDDFRALTSAEMLERCTARPLLFEPGTQTEYSNVGYSVAALIVERVSGQPLEDFLRERVWVPNGLTTFGYLYPEDTPFTFARGYQEDETSWPVLHDFLATLNGDFWVVKGNGGLQASPREMRDWHHVMRGEGTLSPELLAAWMTPVLETAPGEFEGYGLLYVLGSDGEIAQISHAGSDGVFMNYMFWDRQNDLFFYIVGNAGTETTEGALMSAFDEIIAMLEE